MEKLKIKLISKLTLFQSQPKKKIEKNGGIVKLTLKKSFKNK